MKINLIIVVLVFVLFSCKKDDPTPQTTYNPSNTSQITTGLPANTTTINGVFLAHKYFSPPSANISYESFAALYVTGQPLQTINPQAVTVIGNDYGGSIKINSDILKFETSNPAYLHRYTDTLLTPNYSQALTWAFTGDTSFAGFNINVDRGFPLINNTNFIPNTISKSQTLTLTFGANAIANADSIMIQLSGSSLNLHKNAAGNAPSVMFTPAELSSAVIGGTAQFFVYVKNYSYSTVANKSHVFVLVNSFNAFASIAP